MRTSGLGGPVLADSSKDDHRRSRDERHKPHAFAFAGFAESQRRRKEVLQQASATHAAVSEVRRTTARQPAAVGSSLTARSRPESSSQLRVTTDDGHSVGQHAASSAATSDKRYVLDWYRSALSETAWRLPSEDVIIDLDSLQLLARVPCPVPAAAALVMDSLRAARTLAADGQLGPGPVSWPARGSSAAATHSWTDAALETEDGRRWHVERHCTREEEWRAARVHQAAAAPHQGGGGEVATDGTSTEESEFVWVVVAELLLTVASASVCGPTLDDEYHYSRPPMAPQLWTAPPSQQPTLPAAARRGNASLPPAIKNANGTGPRDDAPGLRGSSPRGALAPLGAAVANAPHTAAAAEASSALLTAFGVAPLGAALAASSRLPLPPRSSPPLPLDSSTGPKGSGVQEQRGRRDGGVSASNLPASSSAAAAPVPSPPRQAYANRLLIRDADFLQYRDVVADYRPTPGLAAAPAAAGRGARGGAGASPPAAYSQPLLLLTGAQLFLGRRVDQSMFISSMQRGEVRARVQRKEAALKVLPSGPAPASSAPWPQQGGAARIGGAGIAVRPSASGDLSPRAAAPASRTAAVQGAASLAAAAHALPTDLAVAAPAAPVAMAADRIPAAVPHVNPVSVPIADRPPPARAQLAAVGGAPRPRETHEGAPHRAPAPAPTAASPAAAAAAPQTMKCGFCAQRTSDIIAHCYRNAAHMEKVRESAHFQSFSALSQLVRAQRDADLATALLACDWEASAPPLPSPHGATAEPLLLVPASPDYLPPLTAAQLREALDNRGSSGSSSGASALPAATGIPPLALFEYYRAEAAIAELNELLRRRGFAPTPPAQVHRLPGKRGGSPLQGARVAAPAGAAPSRPGRRGAVAAASSQLQALPPGPVHPPARRWDGRPRWVAPFVPPLQVCGGFLVRGAARLPLRRGAVRPDGSIHLGLPAGDLVLEYLVDDAERAQPALAGCRPQFQAASAVEGVAAHIVARRAALQRARLGWGAAAEGLTGLPAPPAAAAADAASCPAPEPAIFVRPTPLLCLRLPVLPDVYDYQSGLPRRILCRADVRAFGDVPVLRGMLAQLRETKKKPQGGVGPASAGSGAAAPSSLRGPSQSARSAAPASAWPPREGAEPYDSCAAAAQSAGLLRAPPAALEFATTLCRPLAHRNAGLSGLLYAGGLVWRRKIGIPQGLWLRIQELQQRLDQQQQPRPDGKGVSSRLLALLPLAPHPPPGPRIRGSSHRAPFPSSSAPPPSGVPAAAAAAALLQPRLPPSSAASGTHRGGESRVPDLLSGAHRGGSSRPPAPGRGSSAGASAFPVPHDSSSSLLPFNVAPLPHSTSSRIIAASSAAAAAASRFPVPAKKDHHSRQALQPQPQQLRLLQPDIVTREPPQQQLQGLGDALCSAAVLPSELRAGLDAAARSPRAAAQPFPVAAASLAEAVASTVDAAVDAAFTAATADDAAVHVVAATGDALCLSSAPPSTPTEVRCASSASAEDTETPEVAVAARGELPPGHPSTGSAGAAPWDGISPSAIEALEDVDIFGADRAAPAYFPPCLGEASAAASAAAPAPAAASSPAAAAVSDPAPDAAPGSAAAAPGAARQGQEQQPQRQSLQQQPQQQPQQSSPQQSGRPATRQGLRAPAHYSKEVTQALTPPSAATPSFSRAAAATPTQPLRPGRQHPQHSREGSSQMADDILAASIRKSSKSRDALQGRGPLNINTFPKRTLPPAREQSAAKRPRTYGSAGASAAVPTTPAHAGSSSGLAADSESGGSDQLLPASPSTSSPLPLAPPSEGAQSPSILPLHPTHGAARHSSASATASSIEGAPLESSSAPLSGGAAPAAGARIRRNPVASPPPAAQLGNRHATRAASSKEVAAIDRKCVESEAAASASVAPAPPSAANIRGGRFSASSSTATSPVPSTPFSESVLLRVHGGASAGPAALRGRAAAAPAAVPDAVPAAARTTVAASGRAGGAPTRAAAPAASSGAAASHGDNSSLGFSDHDSPVKKAAVKKAAASAAAPLSSSAPSTKGAKAAARAGGKRSRGGSGALTEVRGKRGGVEGKKQRAPPSESAPAEVKFLTLDGGESKEPPNNLPNPNRWKPQAPVAPPPATKAMTGPRIYNPESPTYPQSSTQAADSVSEASTSPAVPAPVSSCWGDVMDDRDTNNVLGTSGPPGVGAGASAAAAGAVRLPTDGVIPEFSRERQKKRAKR